MGYDRNVRDIGDRLLIESRCHYCGFRIVGSVAQSLEQDENDHREKCLAKAKDAASAD